RTRPLDELFDPGHRCQCLLARRVVPWHQLPLTTFWKDVEVPSKQVGAVVREVYEHHRMTWGVARGTHDDHLTITEDVVVVGVLDGLFRAAIGRGGAHAGSVLCRVHYPGRVGNQRHVADVIAVA